MQNMTSRANGPSGLYKMQTFARLTGLAPTTLRAWERRHRLLEPERRDSGHRLYTEEDLRVIRRVQAMLEEGRAIGEVAALGRRALLGVGGPADSPAELNGFLTFRRHIVEAAREIDSDLLSRTLDRAFSLFSVESVLAKIIQPATHEIGDLWAQGRVPIAGEHLVTAALMARIERVREIGVEPYAGAPHVMCACLPGERHELGLLVLSLYLARAGFRVSYLGSNLPMSELKTAAARLDVTAVCLSAKRAEVVERCGQELIEIARTWAGRIGVHLGGVGSSPHLKRLSEAGVHVWPRTSSIQDLIAKVDQTNRRGGPNRRRREPKLS